MTKRFGFTLAEVLITLGIIGVVAAMTIPTLVSNTNGAQFKTGYKKALSSLNQAALMNVALDNYDFASVVKYEEDSDGKAVEKTIDHLLGKRMSASCEDTTDYAAITSFNADDDDHTATTITNVPNRICTFADNTAFVYYKDAAGCDDKGDCLGFIDANSTTGPNTLTTVTYKADGTIDQTSINDVYPVYYYDSSVEPASDAARVVLFGK